MLTKESISVILFALPVYQLLFYTVQLISFKRKNPSKKYLGLLLLSMTLFLILNASNYLGYTIAFSYFYIVFLPVLLSVAPVYFLYILSITREDHDINKRQRIILFLPSILFLIINVFVFVPMSPQERLALFTQASLNEARQMNEVPGMLLGFWIGAILLVFGQIFFAIMKVSKIMQIEADMMRKNPSYLAYLDWNWILGISVSVMIFLVINVLMEILVPMSNIAIMAVYNVLMLLTGGLTGYLGMKQDTLLNQVVNTGNRKIPEEAIQEKLDNNRTEAEKQSDFMSKDEAMHIQKMILEYLENDKPYLNTGFSMHDLCNHLNLSRRKISYVLNEVLDKNFYGVVNEFRIKEAEELLCKDEMNQVKIEVLGEMVGFQSKSSFNACFKKVTGMTPSEYKMKNRIESK